MSLRLRLIVAFMVLAVVPLGAMTWLTYTNNVQVFRDAAEHESELLADELSQRMLQITAQLGAGLMDLDSKMPSVAVNSAAPSGAPSSSSPASAAPAVSPSSPAGGAPASAGVAGATGAVEQGAPIVTSGETSAAIEAELASGLGDAAMLLNNVELRGLYPPPRGGGRGPSPNGSPGPGSGPSRGGRGDPPNATREGPSPRRGSPPGGPPPNRPGRGTGATSSGIAPSAPGASTAASGSVTRATSPATPGSSRAVPETADPQGSAGSSDRITVDLSALRREMFREIAPDKSFDELEPAERVRVIGEINQRLLGIQQGLKIGAAELQKQADEAKRESASKAAPAAPIAPRVATPPAAAGSSGGVAQTARASAPPAPTTPGSGSRLSGNRLTARRERNGVMRQVNAEVNLPNLVSTVFSATPRDRGEVPFAIGKDGHIYAPNAADRQRIVAFPSAVTSPDGKVGPTRLRDWIVVTKADTTGSGLKFGIARPVGEGLKDLRRSAARTAGLGLLFICGTLIVIVPLSTRLTRNLSRLNSGVERIASGDFSARVLVKSRDEVGQLALAFNQMAADVERHQRAAVGQERIRRELELGRQIQADMLPHAPLRVGETVIDGDSQASGEVGGDFYNYFELQTGHVALLIGDVSGKGVGAALLMANLQASLRTRLTLGQELTSMADALDRDIEDNTPGPVYATLFVAALDPQTRVLRYVNAGHHPQYVLRRGGGLERLESSGLPIGLIAGRGYQEGRTQLATGDVVFCYTDGCVEAENESGEMFGSDTFERALLAAVPVHAGTADALLRHMEEVLRTFRGRREPFDDATMMVMKVG